MEFANRLIYWYLQNKRDLPWRETKDPYKIWISEIILQQTRVLQGLPYYFAFTNAFPTVFDLANASEEQVLKLWQGLGYYSRARNLHATAKFIANENAGIFPQNYLELLNLKGVGSYTAAAIASFCYDEAVPVVDGNVYRVLSRIFEVETDISQNSAKKEFFDLAKALLPNDNAASFNQAIMEFGAIQCVPKNPDCSICPFNDGCLALQKGKIDTLPLKLKKTKVSKRYFNYLVFEDDLGNTLLEKRTSNGIWQNLYEFPVIEENVEQDWKKLNGNLLQRLIQNRVVDFSQINPSVIVHKLSHQHLNINFWEIRVEGTLENGIPTHTVADYPVPAVLHNFIKTRW